MGENVTVPVDGGTANAYLARPTSGNGPGVLVLPAWWGLGGHIKSVADQLAGEGFVALAPDVYRGETASGADEAMKLATELPADRTAADLVGAARYLATAKGTSVSGRVGAVGFGLGGSLALWGATLSADIVAASAFYPLVPWQPTRPDWSAFAGTTAIVHAAAEDAAITGPEFESAGKEVADAGGELTVYDYPDTLRGFYNDDRLDAYDPHASASAWARTLELFRTHLS